MNDSPFQNSILMQYETPLPDNFGMKQVRQRIRQVSSPFDHYKGLHFKLYGVNDRIETPLNEYSSIYLWSCISAMREFLVGDLFNNYAQAFARPSIKSWMPQMLPENGDLLLGSEITSVVVVHRGLFFQPRLA